MVVDWKIYSIGIGVLLLATMILFLDKVFFFLVIALATVLMAIALGFFQPLKYVGIELVTLSTMLVGVLYGPVLGGIYAFTILLTHFILGHYYIGTFLAWVLPEYIILGVLSGILRTSIIGPVGVSFIVGMNLINLFLTFAMENDRIDKELPYAIGNSIINSIILVQFFSSIVNFIS